MLKVRTMLDRVNLPTDPVSILAVVFGAAVIVPSMIALVISLLAVADLLLR